MNDPRFEPLPSDSAKHLDRFVRDLAWGALNKKWRNAFYIQGIPAWRELELSSDQNPDLKQYLTNVWDNHPPDPAQLEDFGYIEEIPGSSIGDDTSLYKLTEKGLRLARSASPGPIFISYRRVESSSFALLLAERLKANGLTSFLDNQTDKEDQGISLKPGGEWESDLKAAIEAREYFIALVGPTTLSSGIVCQELQWAVASHKKIIPIWHRGFDPKNKEHFPETLPAPLRKVITDINAIQVIAEDPHQYEVAIEKLLLFFRATSNATAARGQHVKQFRKHRVEILRKREHDELPIVLGKGGYISVVHLIPLTFEEPGKRIDIFSTDNPSFSIVKDLLNSFSTGRFNFDGYVRDSGQDAYTQYFRTGVIESVGLGTIEPQHILKKKRFVSLTSIAKHSFLSFKDCLNSAKGLQIEAPFFLLVSLIDLKGVTLVTYGNYRSRTNDSVEEHATINQNILLLPEIRVENYDQPPEQIFRPLFDILWNTAGLKSCPYYDDQGNWKQD